MGMIHISAAIRFNSSKFLICVHKILMEGSVSQNVDIGHSIFLRECRNLSLKKMQKVTRFFT